MQAFLLPLAVVDMIVGKIENDLKRGFVQHRLNCLLITDPMFSTWACAEHALRVTQESMRSAMQSNGITIPAEKINVIILFIRRLCLTISLVWKCFLVSSDLVFFCYVK